MLFLCLTGALLNIAINKLFTAGGIWILPLYLDTILTITATLLGGFFWGILTGALTNIIGHTINFWGWEGYLFTLCSIATALITWVFIRQFPQEIKITNDDKPQIVKTHNSQMFFRIINRIIVLILLSFTLCLAMSLLGGLISALIQIFGSSPADELHLSALLGSTMFPKMNVILMEILSRIPINIIDRLISVFAGYGIAIGVSAISSRLWKK